MVRSWVATSLIAFLVTGCDLPVDGQGDPSQVDAGESVDGSSAPVTDASNGSADARRPDAGTPDPGDSADGGDEASDPGGEQGGGQGDQRQRGRGH